MTRGDQHQNHHVRLSQHVHWRVLLMIVLILLAYALLAAQPVAAARRITVTFSSFPIPSSSDANSITSGSDGALWFTENGSNQIGRITTSGAITEYPIPTANSRPLAITTGPDGALWFTEHNGNQIGIITTSGTSTAYPITSSISQPHPHSTTTVR